MFRSALELKLQRIVLGNLPFLGISYQGGEKDKQYRERFSDKSEMKKVMKVAVKYGVRFFASSSHRFNELSMLHLEAIKEVEEEEETDISLIACISIPLQIGGAKVNDYKRWKTHLTYESEKFGSIVLQRVLNDPILNFRPQWRENLRNVRPYRMTQLQRDLKIDWKIWEDSIDRLADWKIAWIEPGSETDFLALSRSDLLGELIDGTRDAGYRCLLGSHHLGATAPLLEEKGMRGFDGYVTPINKLGVMMFPTQKETEKAIRKSRSRGNLIIAIKPFAGGRIKPREALTYVFRKVKVDASMMGVASVKEAEEDFEAAREILTEKRREE
ncbi:TPA: hypothetical protein EYP75_03370 [Candidatus Bathyarchaeota archaeon]|nr:hypothetical protein [Candidatus Bathyarchaeota archaeon]